MTILRTDFIGPHGEMQMRLVQRRGSYFVQARHETQPVIVGFRRINCSNMEQAERSYCRSMEASRAELVAAGDVA
jgi:hypothetical protein